MKARLLLLVGLLALLSPFASAQTVRRAQPVRSQQAEQARSVLSAPLRKGDIFELRLSGMPLDAAQEFNLQYTVDDNGRVKIPYVGEIAAAGSNVTQLARAIEQRLVSEKIFTHPTAVINLQPTSRFITVGGEVRAPSTVPWTQDLTLSVAIKRVGGPGEWGSLKKIKVIRDGKSQVFNLTRAEKDPSQNPMLMPGDEVEVM